MTVPMVETVPVVPIGPHPKISRLGPWAEREQHPAALASPGGQPTRICCSCHHLRPDDDEIERIDKCRDHRGRQLGRRRRHGHDPFDGDALTRCRSQSHRRCAHERGPGSLSGGRSRERKHQRRAVDLHHRSSTKPTERQQVGEIGPNRQHPLLRQGQRTRLLTERVQRPDLIDGERRTSCHRRSVANICSTKSSLTKWSTTDHFVRLDLAPTASTVRTRRRAACAPTPSAGDARARLSR